MKATRYANGAALKRQAEDTIALPSSYPYVFVSWLVILIIAAQTGRAQLGFESPVDRSVLLDVRSYMVEAIVILTAFQVVNLSLFHRRRVRKASLALAIGIPLLSSFTLALNSRWIDLWATVRAACVPLAVNALFS